MKLEELRSIAKSHHINPTKLSQTDLVRSIQSVKGNAACFASAYNSECDQSGSS